jgi:asparagine synthetase B (glutamine-hydrolysing)
MTVAQEVAAVIRERMLAYCSKAKGHRVVVALSGGVDSCACLAALLETGNVPIVVSYTPDTHESTDFQMARQTAENLGLEFYPAVVDMSSESLERAAREVLALGWKTKVQVESLVPMVFIAEEAAAAGATVLLTGDQSDGYFALSRGAQTFEAAKYGGLRVAQDTTSERIDRIRASYYDKDKSCSGAVRDVCETKGLKAGFPFRDKLIYEAFLGTLWPEVNKPRVKEPIKQAFEEWFSADKIQIRKVQVNLHKGDSHFGDTFFATLAAQPHLQGNWASPRGLYAAMARGEV